MPENSNQKRGSFLKWQPDAVSWMALALFMVVAVLPFMLMLCKSFSIEGQLSFQNYNTVFSDSRVAGLLLKSFSLSAGAALLSLIFGVPFALVLARFDFVGRKISSLIYLVPLFIPPHVHALAWIYLFGPQGVINKSLMNILHLPEAPVHLYSVFGAAVVLALSYFPILVLLTLTGLFSMDARMEEPASMHHRPLRVLRTITLPLIAPYIGAGAVFVFIFSFFNYGVPSMLRVPSFPVEIFTRFSAYYDEGGATALSLPMVAVALLLMGLQWQFMKKKSFVSTASGSRKSTPRKLPQKYALAASCFVSLILLTAIALPLCSLLIQSASLESFKVALQTSHREILTTFFVAAAAAIVTTALAYFLTMYIHNRRSSFTSMLDICTYLPFAFPAALFGIGLIYLWNRPATQIVYGTILILIIACTARFIPFAIRIINFRLQQISPSLREAALMHEGRWSKRFLCIDMPLVRRGLLICAVITFIFATSELGATLLVIPPGQGTIALKIYTLMHYGSGPLVAAQSLLLIGMNLLASSILLIGLNKNCV
ncbi:iron ABC transporter permease [Myxococcota bacterium]|nr:iron ABC transporter permease [Myxococcota bacterium]